MVKLLVVCLIITIENYLNIRVEFDRPAYWCKFVKNIKFSNINLIKFELEISSVKNGNVPLHTDVGV